MRENQVLTTERWEMFRRKRCEREEQVLIGGRPSEIKTTMGTEDHGYRGVRNTPVTDTDREIRADSAWKRAESNMRNEGQV